MLAIVQKNTIDEFPIHYILEGNLSSKNLLVMIHGGGMDLHELGSYIGLFNNEPQKYLDSNGNYKTRLYQMPFGNYDRIAYEIEANELDTAILRIDMRNHGESKKLNDKMDTRDLSIIRLAKDTSCVIDEVIDKYQYENISLFGTCLGGLVSQAYAIGLGQSTDFPMHNKEKIRSIILSSPLSFANLYTNDKTDFFCYKKMQLILKDPTYQFNKMPGVYEGINTIKEAKKYGDISSLVANLYVPILYLYGAHDRLVSPVKSKNIANNMKSINNQVRVKEINDSNKGFSDHCFYDPQSSDALFLEVMNFIKENIPQHKKIRIS